jgi:hypothetical protein
MYGITQLFWVISMIKDVADHGLLLHVNIANQYWNYGMAWRTVIGYAQQRINTQ